jgi:chromosomal replication initiator protein
MTYARAVGFSEAGRRIYEAGLRYQKAHPEPPEPPRPELPSERMEREIAEYIERDRRRSREADRRALEAAARAEEAARRVQSELRAARAAEMEARIQAALNGNGTLHVADVVFAVCCHFRKSRIDLLSKRRTRTIVRPRQIAMYLAKEVTGCSLPELGRRMGGRDHTTVLHAIRTIASLIEAGDPITADVKAIRKALTGSEEPGA